MTQTWPSYHFRGMGCTIRFWLATDAGTAAAPFHQAEELFAHYEQVFSRFRPDSELSRLNEHAGQWTTVSPLMWELLVLALQWARKSGGVFDPTLLHPLAAAGYDRSFELVPGGGPALPLPDLPMGQSWWRYVRLDEAGRAVYLPPGAGLDLGGMAKGYAAGQAARLLGQSGPALVDAGGDLTAGEAPPGLEGWPVALATPRLDRPEALWPGGNAPEDVARLWLKRGSLATSGVDFRRWQQHGRPAHHLIDPRTGRPAETDLLSATVLASDAVAADVVATVAVILGRAKGLALLEQHSVPACLVTADGRVWATSIWPLYAGEARRARPAAVAGGPVSGEGAR